LNAQAGLHPHQLEALFSKGAILANEVRLGKTTEA
jgi:hypothetical protein